MKRTIGIAAVILLGIAAAAYFYLQRPGQPAPAPAPAPVQAQVSAPPPPPIVTPVIRYPIEPLPASANPLPQLDGSDALLLEALRGVAAGKRWLAILFSDGLIRRFVASVDNLPRQSQLPVTRVVKPVAGPFATTRKGDVLVIEARNAGRYAAYVRIFEAIDSHKLVGVYRLFYPLFQQAYEELDTANAYFNDRLVVAIDDLLAAPVIKGPIKLVQPGLLYEFADHDLEALSAGQKMMIRIGNGNAARLQAKLREIRQEVTSAAGG